MPSITEQIQSVLVRATGTTPSHYTGDWHRFLDLKSIAAGQLNERQIAYAASLGGGNLTASAALKFLQDVLLGGVLGPISAAASAAYSPRLLTSTYTGSAIRVRRSTDNVESNIGFTASGDLDESALTTFIGANSAFVTTVYDQSGNGRNLVQAVAANQPRIVNAGVIDRIGTRAAYRTDGTAQYLVYSGISLAQPYSRSSVVQFIDPTVGASRRILDNGSDVNAALHWGTAGNLGIWAGVAVQTVKSGVVANDKATLLETYNGASSAFSYNGTSAGVAASPGTAACNGLSVGASFNGLTLTSNNYGDILIFPVALTTSDRLVLEANQKAYWGTP